MKPYIISRTIVILLFGLFVGISTYHSETKNAALSRDEFLKHEALYFDRHYADLPPLSTAIARNVLVIGFGFGLYELIAFGILKLLQLFEKKDRRSKRMRRQV